MAHLTHTPSYSQSPWRKGLFGMAMVCVTLVVHASIALVMTWSEASAGDTSPGAMGLSITLNTLGVDQNVATQAEETQEQPAAKQPPPPPKKIEPIEPVVKKEPAKKTPKKVVEVQKQPTPVEPIPQKQDIKNIMVTQAEIPPAPVMATPSVESAVYEENSDATEAVEKTDIISEETLDAQQSASRAVAAGGQHAGMKETYISKIAHWLARHKKYPSKAKRRRQEGTVLLHFVINKEGDVINFSITDSSGFRALDQEALKMIQRAAPFPSIPDELALTNLSISVPVAFDLKHI